jgi:hypothetical protein
MGMSAALASSLYEESLDARITITSQNSIACSSSAARIIAPSAVRIASAPRPLSRYQSREPSRRIQSANPSPVALEPRVWGVAYDRENSRAPVAAAKSTSKPERAQVGPYPTSCAS